MSLQNGRKVIFIALLGIFALIIGLSANYLSSAQNTAAMSVSPQRFDTLVAGQGRVAVFFSEESCSDCAKMSPLWQKVSEMYGGSIAFLEVSYSLETSQIFAKYDVVNTPTFILFADGSNVSRFNGAFSSPSAMEQFVQNGSTNSQSLIGSYLGNLSFLESETPAILISLVLGICVFASPCALPLLPGYLGFLVGVSSKSKRRIGISSLSSFASGLAGILVVGVLFVVLGDLFWSVIVAGKLLIVFALMALGAASILGLGIFASASRYLKVGNEAKETRGVTSYSFIYGLLALGCSLPLMAGAMLNILAGIDTVSLISRLLAFGIGFAVPLAFFTYATGRGIGFSTSRLGNGSRLLQKVGGATMIVASVVMLFTSI